MWKKFFLRGISSYCACVTVNTFIYLFSALCGAPYVCTPEFAARTGGELTAIFLQQMLIGLIGFSFGAGSIFFEMEHWGFLKQGAAHLALTAAVWVIVELICFTPITPPVVISFTLSALASYAITWSIQYFVWRSKVRKLNEQIRIRNEEKAS